MYFMRRERDMEDVEDLVQQTLAAIWRRDDYQFEGEDQFIRVCFGFAAFIQKAHLRDQHRNIVNRGSQEIAASATTTCGLNATEMEIFADQVKRVAEAKLNAEEWQTIQSALSADLGETTEVDHGILGNANAMRVRLYRVRKKLARLVGWVRE